MKNIIFDGLGFIHSPLDRRAGIRTTGIDLLAGKKAFIFVEADRACVQDQKIKYFQDVSNFSSVTEPVFLGLLPDQLAVFAVGVENIGGDWPDLRSLASSGEISAAELSILAQARSLINWHVRHGFCANCGKPTQAADYGLKRICASCGAEHFPRTDPVVILTVTHGSKILLGRGLQFPENLYSALAGFMEPGETIEQAAYRELVEETGIRAKNLTYVASQPWPFPSSLMIGLVGEAENDEIIIDPNELADARWFSKADVESLLLGQNAQYLAPKKHAIAHHLLRFALAKL